IRELLKRLRNPALLWRWPEYTKALISGFHTNLTSWDMAILLLEARHVSWKNMRLMSLPGTPYGKLWKMNPETTQKIVAMMQAPALRRTALESQISNAAWRGKATVEVWNASKTHMGAKMVMSFLR